MLHTRRPYYRTCATLMCPLKQHRTHTHPYVANILDSKLTQHTKYGEITVFSYKTVVACTPKSIHVLLRLRHRVVLNDSQEIINGRHRHHIYTTSLVFGLTVTRHRDDDRKYKCAITVLNGIYTCGVMCRNSIYIVHSVCLKHMPI